MSRDLYGRKNDIGQLSAGLWRQNYF